jgi:hypothetical protein
VRQEHERAALGNRISFIPVEVPLHLDDPIEILQAVHLNTREMKESKVAESVGLMFEALQGMPAPMQALALNGAANPMVQGVLSHVTAMPPANMICTNVPGPNIPLYVMGKRLAAMYPKVPVVMEMGINLALTSYDQKLFLCFCADGRAGKQVDLFRRCFEESFARLREAAAVKSADYVRITRGSRPEPQPEPAPAPAAAAAPAPAQEAPAQPKKRSAKSVQPKAAPKAVKKKAAVKPKAPAKAKSKSKASIKTKATPRVAAKSASAPAETPVVAHAVVQDHGHHAHAAENGAAPTASGTPRIHVK